MGVPAQGGEARGSGLRADLPWLAGLVLVALVLRGWQLTHAEVLSRDSIDYIRMAWRLQHDPWQEVLRRSPQHPGYPLVLLAVSLPVRHFGHGDLAALMQLSAQLASAAAAVLLVIPMFYLGRELFHRRIGFWTALLFQGLPVAGREMADGLSEPVFLLAAAAALIFACRGLRGGGAGTFALAGLCSGLAYLTRPEGALVAGLTGVVVLARQALPLWRRPWRQFLYSSAALTLGLAAVGGPFAWTIGGATTKPAANDVLHHMAAAPDSQAGRYTTGPVLAVWWPDDAPPTQRTWWGLAALMGGLCRAFFFVYWIPTLLGLWWFRDRFRLIPGTWVMALLCLSMALLLYRVAVLMGYLSDRHTLLIVLCGSYFGMAALVRLANLLAGLAARGWAGRRVWSAALLAVAVLGPLPRALERLHADRAAFRTAGYWLAAHTLPGDTVLDPYRWAYYYAGRIFTEGQPDLPASRPPRSYLVVDQSSAKQSHLPEYHASTVLAQHFGKLQETFRVAHGTTWTEVAVYEMHWPWASPPSP
jgi:hypothetical protein